MAFSVKYHFHIALSIVQQKTQIAKNGITLTFEKNTAYRAEVVNLESLTRPVAS